HGTAGERGMTVPHGTAGERGMTVPHGTAGGCGLVLATGPGPVGAGAYRSAVRTCCPRAGLAARSSPVRPGAARRPRATAVRLPGRHLGGRRRPAAVAGRILVGHFRRGRSGRQLGAHTAARRPAVLHIRKAHGASVSFYGLRIARSGIFPARAPGSTAPGQGVLTRRIRLATALPIGAPAPPPPPGGGTWPAMTGRIACFTLPSFAPAGILTRRPCASACPRCLALR